MHYLLLGCIALLNSGGIIEDAIFSSSVQNKSVTPLMYGRDRVCFSLGEGGAFPKITENKTQRVEVTTCEPTF